MIYVSFELECVEFGILIPGIPLPEVPQKECRLSKAEPFIWLQESSGCTKNETADRKLWVFNSTPIELTIAENS